MNSGDPLKYWGQIDVCKSDSGEAFRLFPEPCGDSLVLCGGGDFGGGGVALGFKETVGSVVAAGLDVGRYGGKERRQRAVVRVLREGMHLLAMLGLLQNPGACGGTSNSSAFQLRRTGVSRSREIKGQLSRDALGGVRRGLPGLPHGQPLSECGADHGHAFSAEEDAERRVFRVDYLQYSR